jgi:cell division protein FtsI (penicillin-binding protein 3)
MSIPSYAPPRIKPERLTCIALIPLIASVCILARLAHLGTFGGEEHRQRAQRQHYRNVSYPELRGRLMDADHRELASSTFVETLYVRPHLLFSRSTEMPAAADVVTSLALALELPEDNLFETLDTTRTVVLKRRMSPSMAKAARDILTSSSARRRNEPPIVDSRGWWFRRETIRSYTRGEFAPHVTGYTIPNSKGDAEGLDGIERVYNAVLNATTSTARIRQTALGTHLTPVESQVIESSFGHNIVMTLNTSIQKAAEQALAAQVQAFRAESGVCVVVEPRTGAILAMANVPTFDLNARTGTSDLQRRNRSIADSFEPGSVMKTFTYLTALDEGKITPIGGVNCEGGHWNISRSRTIRDAGRIHGMTNFSTAFADSSNVAAVKVALQLSKQGFHERLRRMGFGQKTGIDLPGETGGILYPVQRWSEQSIQSLAFGYEMRATAIQLALAGAAIGNDGHLMKPFLVREVLDHRGQVTSQTQPTIISQIASPRACQDLLTMMAQTIRDGTGKAAQLDGWTAGGKTGTTKLVDPKTRLYAPNLYVSSFLGLAPLEKPRIAMYVSIRRPDPSIGSGGGAVAAPVFKVVAEAALRALRVPPDANQTTSPLQKEEARDRILREIAGRVPGPELDRLQSRSGTAPPLLNGFMPDLSGLSLREAARIVAGHGWEMSVEGSGVVTEQWPRPMERLSDQVPVRLKLTPMERRIEALAARVPRSAENPSRSLGLLADARDSSRLIPEETGPPALRLRRGQQEITVALLPIADSAAATSQRPTRQSQPDDFLPAGEQPTAAAEMDPPTPGRSAQVWSEYFARETARTPEAGP